MDDELITQLTVGVLGSLIFSIEHSGGNADILHHVQKGPASTWGWRTAFEYIHPPAAQLGRYTATIFTLGKIVLDHPYTTFEGTPLWAAIDHEISALIRNGDLQLATARQYVVGSLCRRVASTVQLPSRSEAAEIEAWFSEQCDSDWEHEFGVAIETLDNPGWTVTVDLEGTPLEDATFTAIHDVSHDTDWLSCRVVNRRFEGSGGPSRLRAILTVFLDWAHSTGGINPPAV